MLFRRASSSAHSSRHPSKLLRGAIGGGGSFLLGALALRAYVLNNNKASDGPLTSQLPMSLSAISIHSQFVGCRRHRKCVYKQRQHLQLCLQRISLPARADLLEQRALLLRTGAAAVLLFLLGEVLLRSLTFLRSVFEGNFFCQDGELASARLPGCIHILFSLFFLSSVNAVVAVVVAVCSTNEQSSRSTAARPFRIHAEQHLLALASCLLTDPRRECRVQRETLRSFSVFSGPRAIGATVCIVVACALLLLPVTVLMVYCQRHRRREGSAHSILRLFLTRSFV